MKKTTLLTPIVGLTLGALALLTVPTNSQAGDRDHRSRSSHSNSHQQSSCSQPRRGYSSHSSHNRGSSYSSRGHSSSHSSHSSYRPRSSRSSHSSSHASHSRRPGISFGGSRGGFSVSFGRSGSICRSALIDPDIFTVISPDMRPQRWSRVASLRARSVPHWLPQQLSDDRTDRRADAFAETQCRFITGRFPGRRECGLQIVIAVRHPG